jgi:hypothetical protein
VIGNVAAGIAGDLPWIAPFVVAGLPPVFVLLTAHQALGTGACEPRPTHNASDAGSVVAQHVATYPVPMTPPAVTVDGADPVASLVGAYIALGGSAADPQLTRTLASAACVDERTARRRLEPYRSEEAEE